MIKKNNIYFASDFHLGTPNLKDSHKRERKIVEWLDTIKVDAKCIYLVGDIFDFWFEYKKVVPKGFVRLLGKLADLSDNGTEIHFLVGNHDLWIKDYLKEEVGISVHHENIIALEQGKKIYISHGDGLGDGDYFYKFLRKIFTSKICQWLFARIHPNSAIALAQFWSNKSRKANTGNDKKNSKEEILVKYCKQKQKINPVDYYVFGHQHFPLEIPISENCQYINLGDWISHFSYAILSNGKIELKKYKSKNETNR